MHLHCCRGMNFWVCTLLEIPTRNIIKQSIFLIFINYPMKNKQFDLTETKFTSF